MRLSLYNFRAQNPNCQSKQIPRNRRSSIPKETAARVKCDTVIKHEDLEIIEFKHAKILYDHRYTKI